ncbi:MAG: DUF3617 domain-containing protein [Novosphingobium sp.]|nr:DUF3617 domain-containing protein [Novosphingobium sp.]MCP5404311.1 DUF3617 domain-containing protein [Novosphingobium sp.]
MNSRITTVAVIAAALQLAACDSADSGPKTMEEAKEEAGKLERPRPGQYKQTMTVTEFELPGAPPEMAAQLKSALGQSNDQEFCLTEEMSKKGFQDMFQKIGDDGECSYERFNVSGGDLDALLQCQSEAEGKAQFSLAGKVTTEGSDIKVRIDSDNPNSPMGKAKIGMHMVTERIGDCAQPSSE